MNLPLSADEFIATQQRGMKDALIMLDKGMPKNKKVEFTKRNGKAWIKVSPFLKEKKHLTLIGFYLTTKLKMEYEFPMETVY